MTWVRNPTVVPTERARSAALARGGGSAVPARRSSSSNARVARSALRVISSRIVGD